MMATQDVFIDSETLFQNLGREDLVLIHLDGKISGSELATFVAGTTRRFAEGIRLKADGRELETFQLFNPEPDLLGNDRSGSHPFKLRLFYFARAPRFPLAGAEMSS